MSGRDKDIKPLEKLKQFFRAAKGSSVNYKGKADFALTSELEKGISPDSPINTRIRTIKDLSEIIATCRLEDYAVEKLWTLVKDLLQKDVEKDHRHACLYFLKCLIQGQYEKLGIMRLHFFKVVKSHGICEDVPPLLELLQALTDNGRDILHLEDEFSEFLLKWTPEVISAGKAAEILSLLLNVIKYNASYIDDSNIVDVVDLACFLCSWSNKDEVVATSLQVLDTIVCYSNLPPDSLTVFISALCRKVNIHEYSHNCWKIMRNLLGTHMGHSTLYTMCKILQDTSCYNDIGLLRGTVFYINMGLWSNKRVTSLRCTLTSVLPSFLQAMQCNHTVVVYEITLSIHRLVNKFGLELQDPAWDVVLSILEAIIKHVENKDVSQLSSIVTKLHETLCTIEQLIELGQFNGNVRKVFSLIEMSSCMRPESSVLRLITFLSGSIVPTRYEWLTKLDNLLDKYYKQDTRPNVRVKALEVLSAVVNSHKLIYEDELIERVVIPYLQNIDQETEMAVRNVGVQILVNLCLGCESKKCLELLATLEKLLIRRDQHGFDIGPKEYAGNDEVEIRSIVSGLIKIFTIKLHQLPSSHALKAYKILVTFLENHYRNPTAVQDHNQNIPYAIFECLLKIRINKMGQVGLTESSNSVCYSPYLMIEFKMSSDKSGTGTVSPPPSSPAPSSYPTCTVTPFSFASASKVIVTALKIEKDWRVLSLLLQELPSILQNKSLMLGRHGSDIGLIADALCSMVGDKSLNLPESLRNVPQKLNRTEFQSYVFPVIAAISSYHSNLEPSQQQRCIKCLEYGLASRCASQCVMALTTCTLEMRDAMYKLLPEVLLNLSKISATVVIAIPILEFLSTLTSLPKVFASFVGDQYMSVFAIALPYTNPFKYNHYTVSLAHHVIAVWFLKCRLPFRRDFVRFITTGLKANAIAPFEEEKLMKCDLSSLNEDSTSRKRSSSLTEQGSRRRERPLSNAPRLGTDLKPPMDEALFNFHVELTETCIDLMARYTFSSCSARPKRSPIAEFLLSGGQSQTWLLGHKLITVTTSGCSQKPLKNNLCDRCWMVCKSDKKLLSPDGEETDKEDLLKVSRQNSGDKGQDQSVIGDSQKFDVTSSGGTPTDDVKKVFNTETSKLEQLIFRKPENGSSNDLCACWCQGWAEIYVKRPTGDMSWVLRIQNETSCQTVSPDLPLPDVTTLFLPCNKTNLLEPPHLSPQQSQSQSHIQHHHQAQMQPPTSPQEVSSEGTNNLSPHPSSTTGSALLSVAIPGTPSRQSSRESVDEINYDEEKANAEGDGSIDLSGKSRNPVRRSNSSPEMSASWKNPFLKEHSKHEEDGSPEVSKQKQLYPKVSCEAIPEEIAGMSGMTPPDSVAHHTPISPSPSSSSSSKPPPHSQPSPGQKKAHPKLGAIKAREGTFKFDPKTVLEKQMCLNLSVDTGGECTAPKSPFFAGELEAKRRLDRDNLLSINSTGKCESNRSLNSEENRPDLLQTYKRDRSRTISVMSPARKSRYDNDHIKAKMSSPRAKDAPRSGVSPSFVFLQLYHSAHFGSTEEKPILISQNSVIQRAILTLDFIPPFETHKVGVIYVGPGQANCEAEILRNEFGSLRYAIFLQSLGTLINLKNADPKSTFLGGLGKSGVDGKFAYIWQDDVTQVTFHVATLMPNKESDPNCNAKKAHIGNDFVTIVYNESGEEYNIQTVKGQFNYANVIIQPLDHAANKVVVKVRDELSDLIGHSEQKIVSDQNLAILARQLALHANLASLVSRSLKAKNQDPYASNWLERLRKIKRLRQKVLQLEISEENPEHKEFLSTQKPRKADYMDDFTEYT